MIGVALSGLLLSSCAGTSGFIGHSLPEWAGGLPADAPPRHGEPGYNAYIRQVDGNAPDKVAPAPAAAAPPQTTAAASQSPPPAKPQEPINQPIR